MLFLPTACGRFGVYRCRDAISAIWESIEGALKSSIRGLSNGARIARNGVLKRKISQKAASDHSFACGITPNDQSFF